MNIKATVNGKTKSFTLKGKVTNETVFSTIKKEMNLYAPIMDINLPNDEASPLYVSIYDELCDNVVGTASSR